jgi:hypothetical protein
LVVTVAQAGLVAL